VSEHELVEEYRAGRIGQAKFFRMLVVGGMSVGAALSLALAAAPVARADACLPGNCEAGPQPVGAILSASANIADTAANVNASPQGLNSVALNTGNAAAHLVDVAANLPGNTGNQPGNRP
jgi:hypothetical protein